jgi:hypothetical protein
MNVVALDTHAVVLELKSAGFTDSQAEIATFATKTEIATFATKADPAAGLAETKAEILTWMVATIGLRTVVIVGAVLTLVPMRH